jgi:hypothetical protein
MRHTYCRRGYEQSFWLLVLVERSVVSCLWCSALYIGATNSHHNSFRILILVEGGRGIVIIVEIGIDTGHCLFFECGDMTCNVARKPLPYTVCLSVHQPCTRADAVGQSQGRCPTPRRITEQYEAVVRSQSASLHCMGMAAVQYGV